MQSPEVLQERLAESEQRVAELEKARDEALAAIPDHPTPQWGGDDYRYAFSLVRAALQEPSE